LIEDAIGWGIQGKVYVAYDTSTKKKVAIKIFDENVGDREQNKREVDILKLLRTSNNTHGFPLLIDYCPRKYSFS